MQDERDKQWETLQERTRKVGAVKEAVHLLDVCWHDIDVLARYFTEHGAMTPELKAEIDMLQGDFGKRSDYYEQWLNKETVKLDAAMKAMDGDYE